jgi:light-regulated signal transduction histidine kinase (bacteriophytochrome)
LLDWLKLKAKGCYAPSGFSIKTKGISAAQLPIRTERDEGDRVRLTVQDAGVGFDSQAADRLFEAFYTTKNSIIESHHGRLWAAPNDRPGATFSFSIPRQPEGMTSIRGLGAIRTPVAANAQLVMRNL